MKEAWAASVDSLMSGWYQIAGATREQKALAQLRVWVGYSEGDGKISEIARLMRELMQDHGATVLPDVARRVRRGLGPTADREC
jgi:hypothetical protein